MGCDIHILFQVYNVATKKWCLVKQDGDNYILVEDQNIPVFVLPENDDQVDEAYEEFYDKTAPFWFGLRRDYILFAKIANIRNDEGLLDVKEHRGIPSDVCESIKLLLQYSEDPQFGEYHSHTWLLDTEIDTLNMNETPIYKSNYFIRLSDYEELKKKYPEMKADSFYVNHYRYDVKTQSAARGFIYSVEEWENFNEERKALERSRPIPYGEKYNSVYIEVVYTEKVDYGGVREFKKLLSHLKAAFSEQQIRALINFDS